MKTPKKFLIFSQNKAFLIFRKTETPKNILYISGNGTFLYFRKWNFLIFRERYIQEPSIFRTLTYLELETLREVRPSYITSLIEIDF